MTMNFSMSALALVAAFAFAPSTLLAQQDARSTPLFSAQHPLAAMLNAAKAKGKVLVWAVSGGASYAGKIKDVGSVGVIVTELRGKEFFDAWVRLDAIIAMEERVRVR